MRSYAPRCASKLLSSPASSRSNEYESFMTNSRTRNRPPRGRGSSRSFVEKWYQSCGSCLYSCSLKTWGMTIRPEVSHSSAGVRTGQSISCPPIALISSRMIWTTFSCTRQPSGRNVHSPAPTWRMKPPRTSSLWLAASASAGASRRVGRNSCEARAITVVRAGVYSIGISEASAIASAAGFPILSRFGRFIPASIQRSISKKSSSTRMSDETFFSVLPCA